MGAAVVVQCGLATAGASAASAPQPNGVRFDPIRVGGYEIQLDEAAGVLVSKGGASSYYRDRRARFGLRHVKADLREVGSLNLHFHPRGRYQPVPLPHGCHGTRAKERRGTWKGAFEFRGEDGYVELERSRIGGALVKAGDYRCPGHGGQVKAVRLTSSDRPQGGGFTSFSAVVARSGGGRVHYSAAMAKTVDRLVVTRTVAAKARRGTFTYDSDYGHAEVTPGGAFSGTGSYSSGPGKRRTNGPFTGLSADFLGAPEISLDGDATLSNIRSDLERRVGGGRG